MPPPIDIIEQLLDGHPMLAGELADLRAQVEIELTGAGGGTWKVEIAGGSATVAAGRCDTPDVILTLDARDLEAIRSGSLDPGDALAAGRVEVEGDIGVAAQLAPLLERFSARARRT